MPHLTGTPIGNRHDEHAANCLLQRFIDSLHLLHTQILRGCLVGAPAVTNKNEHCTYVVVGAYAKALMETNVLMAMPQAPSEGI
jgi:hypothetical protein